MHNIYKTKIIKLKFNARDIENNKMADSPPYTILLYHMVDSSLTQKMVDTTRFSSVEKQNLLYEFSQLFWMWD